MAAFAKTSIFYISVGFWLILGVECFSGASNNTITVQTGGSVTIPCHYDKKYTQQKKYWYSEIDKSSMYTNTTEQNLSVIDYPDQSLFTVTMRNLQNKHSGDYYCTVETGEQPPTIITYEPHLKIQSDPDVSVVSSSVSGHEGGDISVECLYSSGYKNKLKQWCRYKDQRCYTVGRTDTSQNSLVQICDDDGRRSFTVLMTGLRLTDSGWYFCSTGDLQVPVQLTVTKTNPESVTIQPGTLEDTSEYKNKLKQWCRFKDQSCYTVGRTDTSQNSLVQICDDDGRRSFTVLMTGLRLTDSGWYFCSTGDLQVPVQLTVTKTNPDGAEIEKMNIGVKSGSPGIIPCLYKKHEENRKYWCKGSQWITCKILAYANETGKYSLTDYPNQSIFTVRWENLQTSDSGYYWCAVEICGYNTQDDRYYLYLTVQSVRWENLQTSDSGYYWCAVEIGGYNTPDDGYYLYLKVQSGDLQVPVQLTVTKPKQAPTTIPAATPSDFEIDMRDVILAVCLLVMLVLLLTVALVAIVTWRPRKKQMQWKNLQTSDSGYYWCAVEIGGPDDGYYLYLTVQSVPDVSVVSSSVSGHEGGDISVQCLYSSGYKNVVKQWCRIKDKRCYKEGRTETSQNPSVQITDDGRRSFTVLMTGLRLTDSGWYCCSVGDLQVPVQLTVTKPKQAPTTIPATKPSGSKTDMHTTQSSANTNTITITTESRPETHMRDVILAVCLLVMLVLLLLVTLVAIVTWRLRKKQKRSQNREEHLNSTRNAMPCENQMTSNSPADATFSASVDEGSVIYSSVITFHKAVYYSKPENPVIYSTINDENPNDPSKDITTYSTIDYVPGSEASIFTVQWENLQTSDSGYYWCAVEIGGYNTPDDGYYLYLKVQSVPDVSVVSSSVSGHEGGDISVQCLYSSEKKNEVKQWCRIKDQSCYTVGSTDTSQNSLVKISDDGKKTFTVLMTGLKLNDSGWYFCSVGDWQAPVQLKVTKPKQVPTTIPATKPSGSKTDMRDVILLMFLPAMLVLLVIVTFVAIVTWRLRKKQKRSQNTEEEHLNSTRNAMPCESQMTSHSPADATSSASVDELSVIYSSVIHKAPSTSVNSEGEAIYSAVKKTPKAVYYSKPEDPVIYSTINDENPNGPSKDITTYSTIDHVPGSEASLFTVTMRNLQDNHTGYYYCIVETREQPAISELYEAYLKIQSDPDVSVVSSSVSGDEGGDVSVQCLYSSEYQNKPKQWCRYKDQSCYTVGRTATSHNSSVQISDDGRRSFTVLMTGLRLTDSGWYFCSVGKALNPVHVTVTQAEPGTVTVTEKTFKSETGIHKNINKPEVIEEPQKYYMCTQIYSKPEDAVIYSTINDENPNDPNKDIIYSTIDDVPGSKAVKPSAGGAIYSIIYSMWKNLQTSDSGYYWCAVEIGGYDIQDAGYYLYLTVQSAPTTIPAATPSDSETDMRDVILVMFLPAMLVLLLIVTFVAIVTLRLRKNPIPDMSVVSSSVSGHEGGDISVQCLYSSGYQKKLKQWCRYKNQSCYTVGRTDTSQNSSFQISDDGRRSFTVLMTGLRLTDSGWYCCSVGDLQVPVQLTVTKPKRVPDVSLEESQVPLLTVTEPKPGALLKYFGASSATCQDEAPTSPTTQDSAGMVSALQDELPSVSSASHMSPQTSNIEDEDIFASTSTLHKPSGFGLSWFAEDQIYSKPEDPVIYSTINDENPHDPSKDITTSSTIDYVPGSEAIYSKPEDAVIYSTINDENPNDPNKDIIYSTIDDVPGSKAVKPSAGGAIYSIIYSMMPCEKPMTSNSPADATSSASVDEGSVTYSSVTFHKAPSSSVNSEVEVIYSTVKKTQKAVKKTPKAKDKQMMKQRQCETRPAPLMLMHSAVDMIYPLILLLHITVQWENLQTSDSGRYWCAVEIVGKIDDGYHLYLTVRSVPDVSVVSSSVSGHEGGDISVQCLYSSGYKNKVKQWCRYKNQSCCTVGRNDTSQNSSVQISDDGRRSFTVLMTGLRLTDSGWYCCSVGDLQVPVQLTVTKPKRVPDVSLEESQVPLLTMTEPKPGDLQVPVQLTVTKAKPEIMITQPGTEEKIILAYANETGKYSLTDYPNQNMFTVQWENLQTSDSGYYWCAVEIGDYRTLDDGYCLYLTVQSVPGVSVVSSSVSGHEGGDISVQCLYSSGYQKKPKQWCRYKDQSCYTVGRTNTSQNSSVQISDDGRRSFTVLMTGLRLTDSGWYCCSVGDLQVPVQLSVTKPKRAPTTIPAATPSDSETDMRDVILVMFLPAMLMIVTLVAIVTLRLRKNPKRGRIREEEHLNSTRNAMPCENQMTSNSPADATSSASVDDCSVTYSSVTFRKAPSSSVNSEVEVIYNTVKKTQKAVKKTPKAVSS
ncbi:polymeric immunoglobulin receptor-like protein [Labeo rohita]|nr:polymeric immunoglobulin receptor-like protein [Labeo rohita]